VLGLLRKHPDGSPRWSTTWTNAGHPPPLLLTTGGTTTYLTGAHGLILGANPDRPRPTTRETVPADSTLVLYTDGLK